MPHVKLAGNIRRRNDNGIRVLLRVRLRVKIAAGKPELINSVLYLLRLIRLRKLLAHSVSS